MTENVTGDLGAIIERDGLSVSRQRLIRIWNWRVLPQNLKAGRRRFCSKKSKVMTIRFSPVSTGRGNCWPT